jgi:hypothetical protein
LEQIKEYIPTTNDPWDLPRMQGFQQPNFNPLKRKTQKNHRDTDMYKEKISIQNLNIMKMHYNKPIQSAAL